MVSFDSKETREEREFIAGDYVVAMNQSVGKIILNLLEPNAPDALIRWGFFNTIFEQKEYGEAYKLEELARSMLKDSTIKREFENQLKNDKAFASNSFARFNWFYQRSPYWDQNVNRYPIAKIMTKEGLPK